MSTKFPTPCRNEFERLKNEYPEILLDWVNSGELAPYDLTFAAETLGEIPEALPVLLDLLKHDSSIVREGALIGLLSIKILINDKFQKHAENDPSPCVRDFACGCADR